MITARHLRRALGVALLVVAIAWAGRAMWDTFHDRGADRRVAEAMQNLDGWAQGSITIRLVGSLRPVATLLGGPTARLDPAVDDLLQRGELVWRFDDDAGTVGFEVLLDGQSMAEIRVLDEASIYARGDIDVIRSATPLLDDIALPDQAEALLDGNWIQVTGLEGVRGGGDRVDTELAQDLLDATMGILNGDAWTATTGLSDERCGQAQRYDVTFDAEAVRAYYLAVGRMNSGASLSELTPLMSGVQSLTMAAYIDDAGRMVCGGLDFAEFIDSIDGQNGASDEQLEPIRDAAVLMFDVDTSPPGLRAPSDARQVAVDELDRLLMPLLAA